MDEPTSSVDQPARLALERLGRHLAESGVSVVWVTHDLVQMRRLADHLVVVAGGRIEYSGRPNDLPTGATPAVRAFFAGPGAPADPADRWDPGREDGGDAG
jgi:ABC-type transporter Mla maintaining outer membrane lipid asymmetry ATPase subunit MlaF